jgi:hypothetical protein
MSQTVRIKPAGKHYVRHPDNGNRYLNQDGEEVVMNAWWHRRLADKEIEIIETPTTKTETKESK